MVDLPKVLWKLLFRYGLTIQTYTLGNIQQMRRTEKSRFDFYISQNGFDECTCWSLSNVKHLLARYSDTFRRIICTFPLVPAIWMTDNLSRSSNVTPIFSKYLEVSDTFVHSELWVRPIAFCNVVVFVCSAFNAEIASYNRNKQSRHSPNKTGSDMQILTSYERRSIPFNLEAKWASERQLKVNKCVGANDGPPISNTILTGNRLKILFIYLCPALKLVTSLFN